MGIFRRDQDLTDHSVEPPLSFHEGYPSDEVLREALAAVGPDLRVRMQQEIDNPTPVQVHTPEEAAEILAQVRGTVAEEEVAPSALMIILNRIKHLPTRVSSRGDNPVSAKERRRR